MSQVPGGRMVAKPLLLLLLAATASPAFAARRTTIQQLEQILVAAHAPSDARLAQELSALELTERLSQVKLSHWDAELPGPRSRQALLLLADTSAFLDLPAAELPSRPTPDLAAQRQIIASTAKYAKATISRLPNFFATRQTMRFADTPASFQRSILIPYQPLHPTGTSREPVFYRDGREVVDPGVPVSRKSTSSPQGLTTAGVFGPMLGTVLVDIAHGTLAWSHWEGGRTGTEAVFRYAIPQKDSHYEVSLAGVFRQYSAYHGTFTVDPANGAILRLTIQADLKPDDPILQSDVLVEYGPVEIAGKTYFCPLKSVSVWRAPAAPDHRPLRNQGLAADLQANWHSSEDLQTSVNDVTFADYHVFRAESHVLIADNPGQSDSPGQSSNPAQSNNPAQSGNPDSPNNQAHPADSLQAVSPVPAPPPEAASAPDNTVPKLPSTPAHLPAPFNPEAVTPAVAASSPATPVPVPQPPAPPALAPSAVRAPLSVNQPAATASRTLPSPAHQLPVPTLRVSSRLVYVDAVVHDRHGHVVTGLTQGDFRVSENGAPQTIEAFRAVTGDSPAPPAQVSPIGAKTSGPSPDPPVETANMILFDLLDTSPLNQTYARKQMLKFLEGLPPGHHVALFILTGRQLDMVQGFTGDSALLASAARRLLSESSPLFQSADAQRQNNDATGTMPGLATPGGQDTGILQDLAGELSTENFQHGQVRDEAVGKAFHALAAATANFNGRKNLFWLAESFPGAASTEINSASRIAVYPISVLGLQGDSINAEMNGNGVTTGAQGMAGAPALSAQIDERAGARADFRNQMETLATQTGGEAFVDTNDLAGALRKSLEDGENYYSLAYAPTDKNWNGRVRSIGVKLTRGGYSLSYRRGYIALPEPPAAPASATR